MKGFLILGSILASLVGALFWAVDAKADVPAAAIVVDRVSDVVWWVTAAIVAIAMVVHAGWWR